MFCCSRIATVELMRHLHAFFPALAGKEIVVRASTVAEVVRELVAPGIAFYVCDERGRLRRHVNIFVGEEPVHDRDRLSDAVGRTRASSSCRR